MSDLNNQIQNYSNNNFSNNTQNNRSPVVLRQSNREMLLNINPEVFQSSILNSINNFINNNRNNQNEQNQIQVWQRFAKELENMSNNLKEAFQAVNENINDLRQKCGESFLVDKLYKENNDKNINLLAQENSALKEKTNQLVDSNSNIIDNNNKLIKKIDKQSENINSMSNNINNLNEDNKKSKSKINKRK